MSAVAALARLVTLDLSRQGPRSAQSDDRRLLMVASDRFSCLDAILPTSSAGGAVLTAVSILVRPHPPHRSIIAIASLTGAGTTNPARMVGVFDRSVRIDPVIRSIRSVLSISRSIPVIRSESFHSVLIRPFRPFRECSIPFLPFHSIPSIPFHSIPSIHSIPFQTLIHPFIHSPPPPPPPMGTVWRRPAASCAPGDRVRSTVPAAGTDHDLDECSRRSCAGVRLRTAGVGDNSNNFFTAQVLPRNAVPVRPLSVGSSLRCKLGLRSRGARLQVFLSPADQMQPSANRAARQFTRIGTPRTAPKLLPPGLMACRA